MRSVQTCPVCTASDRTLVCPHNGLVLNETLRGSELARYDYALCHGCGLVYATRRPVRQEYTSLTYQFKKLLGKEQTWNADWSAQDAAKLRRKLKHGWLVSDEAELAAGRWCKLLARDRLGNFFHFDLLSSLASLEGKRIVEFRTKSGFLLDALRRFYGAEVCAVPMSPHDKQIAEEYYGIECRRCLNFEEIEIPFEGDFDLIIAKHMFTHALYPDRFFATLRERLRPGGAVYLYEENDDRSLFDKRKNLIAEQKCFHFQNFDVATLGRCLRFAGFEPTFICHPKFDSAMCCFARLAPEAQAQEIPADRLQARLQMYEAWYDGSLLCLPEAAKEHLAAEIPAAVERAVLRGDATLRSSGRVRMQRRYRVSHEKGYEAVNERARKAKPVIKPEASETGQAADERGADDKPNMLAALLRGRGGGRKRVRDRSQSPRRNAA